MHYVEYTPTSALSNFVDKLWYCKGEKISETTLTIPFLYSELILNFSDYYTVKKVGDNFNSIANNKSWISGIQTNANITVSKGKHEMLGVLFKPHMIKGFHKHYSLEFTDQFIDADYIFGSNINDLQGKAFELTNISDKFKLIESYLTCNMIESVAPSWLKFSGTILSQQLKEKGDTSDLAGKIGLSSKALIEGFRKHVGLNPTKYNQLQILNKALKYIQFDSTQSMSELAFKLNFYDPSHFSRMFKKYSSLTPSEYASHIQYRIIQNDPEGTDKEYPNFINITG